MIAELDKVHTSGNCILYELDDVSVLGVRLADHQAEHGRPETADAAGQRHEFPS
jgi:hypothetical protein